MRKTRNRRDLGYEMESEFVCEMEGEFSCERRTINTPLPFTFTYEGEVNARGYEDGHGRIFFSHGDEYVGQWKNGDM